MGAGVLVSDRSVLTCAHVVEAALRLAGPHTGAAPEGRVLVDFPASVQGRAEAVPARVAEDGWLRLPPAGDLAVLRLERPLPGGAGLAPLGRCGPDIGGTVAVYGHPIGVPDGVWARGQVVGAGGTHPGWRQIDGLDFVGVSVTKGFSGAGVWDLRRGLVVGLLAAVLAARSTESVPAARVAWMIPLDVLDGTPFAVDARAVDRAAALPARGAEPPPPSVLWPLVDRLLAIESFRVDGGQQLLSQLPSEVVSGVGRQNSPKVQLYQIVRRCGEFEGGPAALVTAVQWMEGDTTAVNSFVEEARKTWPDRLGSDG
ncbi:trypsin-like peptidase domain-containing protein [Streptomyces sp. NPDC050211]|uniref:trypsin-like peptidase domain-containing protein n=1 Tax=Streptomyces sp. NPDC050211 TaxID=3154932 RepID=UPI00344650EA